jgi:hypothetical protein
VSPTDARLWYPLSGIERRLGRPDRGVPDGYLPGWGNGGMPVYRNEFTNLSDLNIRDNFLTFDEARAMASQVSIVNNQLLIRGDWLNPIESAGPRGTLTHNTGYVDWRDLTDAYNPTPKHFSQQWGRWEWRAQPASGPNQLGALSALWLRCDNNQGEIDVMEAYGYAAGAAPMTSTFNTYIKDSAVITFHSSTLSQAVNSKPYRKTFWRHWEHGVSKNPWQGMRTYGFERMPTYMRADVDGVEVFNVTPNSPDPINGVGSSANPSGKLDWLWDTDFYGSPLHARMNLHVGPSATSWGDADPANRALTANLDFKLDYLRIYAAP